VSYNYPSWFLDAEEDREFCIKFCGCKRKVPKFIDENPSANYCYSGTIS